MTTCDRTALEHAIVREPLEDTPRLVYADWCDEHGEESRAEFIRTQIELAAMDGCEFIPLGQEEPCINTARPWSISCGYCKKLGRSREFEKIHGHNWVWACLPREAHTYAWNWKFDFSRGFPSKVTLPSLTAWERWGEAIVRASPVTEIVVADREPDHIPDSAGSVAVWRGLWTWYRYPATECTDRIMLPAMVWDRLDALEKNERLAGFASREQALSLAARAFADEARSRAKLPPVWSKP